MGYDPDRHHCQSIRLTGYDYSQPGGYFVTLVAKDRERIFGRIEGNKTWHNKIGELVKTYWLNIPNHFDNTKLDEFVLMPNHFHGIVIIEEAQGEGEASRLSDSAVPKLFPMDASPQRPSSREGQSI